MKRPHMIGVIGSLLLSVISVSVQAALIGVLPVTTGGTDYQAYYDDQLDITWTANADINGFKLWSEQVTWAAGLNIGGVTGWRLPDMDRNRDGTAVDCRSMIVSQTDCQDNEYGHLFVYGAGTVRGSGITGASPGPFINIQAGGGFSAYWTGTESVDNTDNTWHFFFEDGDQAGVNKSLNAFNGRAWAVHEGNVSAVPVPAAVWLFGSGLLGLIGIARRKKA